VSSPASTGRKGYQPSGNTLAGRKLVLLVLLLFLGAFVGFTYRGHVDDADITDSNQQVLKYRSENGKLKAQIFDLNSKLEQARAQIDSLRDKMQSMSPSESSYVVGVNKSMVVAGGDLTIGLIGSPTSENLRINVNGKEHLATAGDVIQVDPNPSTKCKVTIQSFDMFKAVVTATCEGTKQ
jgi:cell division protein FtsB